MAVRAMACEIAAVRFMIDGGTALPPFPQSYQAFRSPAAPAGEVVVLPTDIRVEQDLRIPPGERVFSSGGSWCLDRDGEGYLLYHELPISEGTAWWLARFPADVSRLVLTINDSAYNHLTYPLDQIVLMYLLGRHGGVIVHGAGFGLESRGIAFLGPSGAGKTTISALLRRGGWSPLSDDRLIIRKIGAGHLLYGTPWPGEGMIAENRSFPLERVFFLQHGVEHRLRELSPADALRRLAAVTSIPWYDREALPGVLDTCDELIRSVRFGELTFRLDDTVRTFLEDAIRHP